MRTAACPIPRPLLVHYPRKTLGHLGKDQELGHVKDVCPRHCSIASSLGNCPHGAHDMLEQSSEHCLLDATNISASRLPTDYAILKEIHVDAARVQELIAVALERVA